MDEIKCILHAGAHKTGTSLLQKYLRDQGGDNDTLGVSYISRSDTNRLIGWGEVPQTSPHDLQRAVQKAVSPQRKTVVVSHENSLGKPLIPTVAGLYPDSKACAEGLADALADFDTTVIYYIRSQAEFIESYYLQTIHQGAFQPFERWLAGIDEASCSWRPTVMNLKAAFGQDRVVVRDFAEISNGQETFIRNFLSLFTDASTIEITYAPKRNFSISQLGLDIALDVNPLLETRHERKAMRKFLQKHFNNSTQDRPALIEPHDTQRINAMFFAENHSLVDVPT